MDENGRRSGPSRWIVIGNSHAAVLNKFNEIHHQTSQAMGKMHQKREQKTKAMQQEVVKAATKGSKQADWDVTGKWVIESDELGGFGNYGNPPEYTMLIRMGVDGNTKAQVYAEFDFDSVTGIVRFVNSGQAPKSSAVSQPGKRPAADDSEIEEEDEDDYYGNETSEYEPSFILHPPFKPSTKNNKWLFRWRGEETGEGEIQLGSDEDLNSITFTGVGGTECSGIMQVPFAGKVKFTGRKVQQGKGPQTYAMALSSAKEQWDQRGERAYERARVGRWH